MKDEDTAAMLGQNPPSADPSFRVGVFARIAERSRRRAAATQAVKVALGFTAIGAVFPLAQAAGVDLALAQPFFIAGGAIALAYLFALAAIAGPAALVARSLTLIRARI